MKETLLFICLSAFTFFVTNAQQEIYGLDDFNDLTVYTSIKMELIASDENKMEIEITKGNRSDLKIEEKKESLKVYIEGKENWGPNETKASIKLYYKELEKISVGAGARVYTDEVIKSEEFGAVVSSGATLTMHLETNALESIVSSGGSLQIDGTSSSVELGASSGGSFQGTNFKCKNAKLEASSGGSIKIWVSESIEAVTSSGGSIKYGGNPTSRDIEKDKWSGGSVISIGND